MGLAGSKLEGKRDLCQVSNDQLSYGVSRPNIRTPTCGKTVEPSSKKMSKEYSSGEEKVQRSKPFHVLFLCAQRILVALSIPLSRPWKKGTMTAQEYLPKTP
jgi:hypothetical protein